MPIYEFKCVKGGETKVIKVPVSKYVDIVNRGLLCGDHKSVFSRVFGTFSFRM